MPTNHAAWQKAAKAQNVVVEEAPYPTPGPGQICVRAHAVAINPFDRANQLMAFVPLDYPWILGSDVAGVVDAVGPDVTRFKSGDRVSGFGYGARAGAKFSEGAFQEYVILNQSTVTVIPANLSFSQTAVLPMSLQVASVGLFAADSLALDYSSLGRESPNKGTLLIWGGSTSIGCSAVQLARAAGYRVISTSSPANFELLRRLGAAEVFDYKSPTVVKDIVAALKVQKGVVGAFDAAGKTPDGNFSGTAAGSSFYECASILQQSEGGKFIAAAQILPDPLPTGIKAVFILPSAISDAPYRRAIYEEYLPRALADGQFVPAPDARVIGNGLEKIQEGLNQVMDKVSAAKVVVTL